MSTPSNPSVQSPDLQSLIVSAARFLAENGDWTDAVTEPRSIGSRFGTKPRRTLEVRNVVLRLSNPRMRLVKLPERPVHLDFALANVLWVCKATKSGDMIMAYNPLGEPFLSEEGEFSGAMGNRMAAAYGDRRALMSVVTLLRDHPATRRAVVPLLTADDLAEQAKDLPCVTACNYHQRDGQLESTTIMRSQSLVGLLFYDIFLFTMLQEIVATELGVPLGAYTHFCSSLHVYEDEIESLNRVAGSSQVGSPAAMDAMIETPLMNERIYAIEEEERLAIVRDADSISRLTKSDLGVDGYWRDLLAEMSIGLRRRSGAASSTLSTLRETMKRDYT